MNIYTKQMDFSSFWEAEMKWESSGERCSTPVEILHLAHQMLHLAPLKSEGLRGWKTGFCVFADRKWQKATYVINQNLSFLIYKYATTGGALYNIQKHIKTD